jgi:Tfp pilus assembly protein PilV
MVEIMASLLIFGVGLLGIMALHVVARKGNADSQNVTAATAIAEHWMERLQTESVMWYAGQSDITTSSTPMLANSGISVGTPNAVTNWVSPPDNPLLNRELNEASTDATSGALVTPGEYCTQYRIATLVPDRVLRVEVRVMWWKEGVSRPANWASCPMPPVNASTGQRPDPTQMHLISMSSTLWRNSL